MQEIRFHGRGGQGTVVASILLAKAFFKAGYDVQTFPLFGVERRGAPVEAYLRLDKQNPDAQQRIHSGSCSRPGCQAASKRGCDQRT
jgi:pyruvate ferredoxin oxidoreductase gamma subunit/2-oxoisovalerate ferredoxin oxidoreductase gamma subunit